MELPAIVLAAGGSRRLGRPKQLLELGGETLLGRAIRAACEGGASPVLVVLGGYGETIAAHGSLEQVVTVLNSEWPEGIASSIRAGIRALGSCVPDAPGAIILSCDQPRNSAAHLRRLIDAFRGGGGRAVAASAYAGVRGIPAVFPRNLFPQLQALEGDKGARSILADAGCPVLEVVFEGGEIDIDTPADMERLS